MLFQSKWTWIVLILVLVPVVLYFLGNKSVKSEVIILATPDEVWSTLTDFQQIKEWNQVLIPQKGSLKEGGAITYDFYQDEGGKPATMDAKVKLVIPGKRINQVGGIPAILTFNHNYYLEKNAEGTQVTITENYRGMMVPFWNPDPVEQAYTRLLLSLKKEVEGKKQ